MGRDKGKFERLFGRALRSCCLGMLALARVLEAGEPFQVVTRADIDFVSVPAGQFVMGTSEAARLDLVDRGWWSRFLSVETPSHLVVISQPFLIGRTEVTQAQWENVMGKAHDKVAFKGKDRPVDSVSFDDVERFLSRLNQTGTHRYRLPTEAEWEYCCRAGSWGLWMIGDQGFPVSFDELDQYCWMSKNSDGRSHAVATLRANAWGVYDMLGNVWEWCRDSYTRDAYHRSGLPVFDPIESEPFPERVLRGGSWYLPASSQRAALRSGLRVERQSPYVGFRLVCEYQEESEERGE